MQLFASGKPHSIPIPRLTNYIPQPTQAKSQTNAKQMWERNDMEWIAVLKYGSKICKKKPTSTHRMAGVTFAIVLVIFVYKRRRRGHYRLKRSVALHIAGQMEISHTQNKKMFYIISN